MDPPFTAGCEICNIPRFNSARQRDEHLAGRTHKAKLGRRSARCDVCDITLTSSLALRDHERGRKHQARVRRGAAGHPTAPRAHGAPFSIPPTASTPVAAPRQPTTPSPVAGCDLCGTARFPSTKHLDEHLVSDDHRARLHDVLGVVLCAESAGEPNLGVLLVTVEPGSAVPVPLEVRNSGTVSWELSTVSQLRPLQGFDVSLPLDGARRVNAGSRLPLVASIRLPEVGVFRALLVAEVTCRDAAGQWLRATLTCDVEFRCASAVVARDIASLAPTSPYQRNRVQRPDLRGAVPPPPTQATRGGPPPFPNVPEPPRDIFGREALLESSQKHQPLSPASHAELFTALLLAEESAAQEALASFDLDPAQLRHTAGGGPLLRLQVTGLAEGRPSLLRGDTVVICRRGGKEREVHRGRIDTVERDAVLLAFSRTVHLAAGDSWSAHFELSRSSYRRQHAALEPGWAPPAAVLFPRAPADEAEDAALARAVVASALPVQLHHTGLNAPQQLAVRGALCRVTTSGGAAQPPFIVFGPPGTGKTSTLAEYIAQVVSDARRRGLHPGPASLPEGDSDDSGVGSLAEGVSRLQLGGSMAPSHDAPVLILVTAPSNSATDELAMRLLKVSAKAKDGDNGNLCP